MSTPTVTADELVSMREIATMLGTSLGTIGSYRSKGYMPEPFATLAIGPIWRRDDIIEWQATRPGKGWRKGRH